MIASALSLAGLVVGAFVGARLAPPPLRALDSAGGLVLGAGAGLALVWIVGAAALLVPGQNELRRAAQRSTILTALYERVPPADFMRLLARVDPFPEIA